MTRKDYIKIAAAFANTRPTKRKYVAYTQWLSDVEAIIRILENDNYRFDSARFHSACLEES